MKLSLCMIVRDEEDTLKRCLTCVKDVVDEIIIVDTGSTDKTKEIASEFTDKIYDFKWVNDFSKARNYSFSKATGDYLMWLDADDVIDKKNIEKLIKIKELLNGSVDVIMANYTVGFDDNDNPTFSYFRERIVKNSKKYRWVSPIHEVIITSGNIIYSDLNIEHRKIHATPAGRNLKIFEEMIKRGQNLDSRQQYYYARELYYNGKYNDAIKIFRNVIKLDDTWIEDKITACEMLSSCYFNIKEDEKALYSLFKSFKFDKPRAKICCLIGNYFLSRTKYDIAIFWYNLAKDSIYDKSAPGFVEKDYFDFIPYINLCVCYYYIGDYKNSKKFNELAGSIKPNDKLYLLNKSILENITEPRE